MFKVTKDIRLLLGLISLFYIAIIALTPSNGFWWDVECWQRWAQYILKHGIGNAYNSDTNYFPGYLYLLQLFGLIEGSEQNIQQNMHYLRDILFLFDIAGVLLAAWVCKKHNINPLFSLFILFNIAYIYNTIIWGQLDSFHTAFGVASLLLALNKKPIFSLIMIVLAMTIKLQSVVFIPVIGIVLLPQFLKDKWLTLKAMLSIMIIGMIIFFPFFLEGHLMDALNAHKRQIDCFPRLSLNAFNIWNILFYKALIINISDKIYYYGLSYKQWGLLMFILSSVVAIIPVTLKFANKNADFDKGDYKLALLTTLIVTLTFFYFNTQMHERYSHSAVLLSGIYCLLEGQYIIYLLTSLAYLLNMEAVLRYFNLPNYGILFMDRTFIAGLFGLIIIITYYKLYKGFHWKDELVSFKQSFRKSIVN